MNIARSRYTPVLLGAVILIVVLCIYLSIHPRGLSTFVVQSYANSAAPLALAAVAQTFPVLTGGLDLSVGGMVALTNALSSELVNGSPLQIVVGIVLVVAAGAACGVLNGLLIVVGKLQPIISTLATGAVFSGLALLVRPFPGGEVDEFVSEMFTSIFFNAIPVSTVAVIFLVLAVWRIVNRTQIGKGIFAAGSSSASAALSGVHTGRSVVLAYVLSGVFAALAGLFLGFQTLSGDATIGVPYTINSIAAVVIGGLSLRGGQGTVVSGILGAHALRAISAVLLFSGAPPLAQPLFEGLVLVLAVSAASYTLVRDPNRLKAYS